LAYASGKKSIHEPTENAKRLWERRMIFGDDVEPAEETKEILILNNMRSVTFAVAAM
jgi:hypothetical protein